MVKPTLVLTALLVLLSGCGGTQPDSSGNARPPASAPLGSTLPGVLLAAGNRVPEEPWWQIEVEEPADPPPPPPREEVYDISSDVLFDESSAALGGGASSQLRHLVDELVGDPTAVVTIVGHTDSTPGPTVDYNDTLSLDRANSVRDWLVENGAVLDRITTDGYADREPVASNETDAGRAANRRVTITIRRTR